MSLSKKEINELKVGNTVKAEVDISKRALGLDFYKTGDSETELCIGKVVEVTENHLVILGYQEGVYKIKNFNIPIKISKISRSRITGKASKSVNEYFKRYMDYLKEKKQHEELIRKKEESMNKVLAEVKGYETKATEDLKKSNYDKIPAGDEIYNKLKELISNKYREDPDYDMMLTKQPRAGAFTVTAISDRIGKSDLKSTRLFVEYDYTTFIEGEEKDFIEDIKRVWHKPLKLTDADLKGIGKVATNFWGETDGGDKMFFRVDYNFDFSKPLKEEQIEKVVKYIESKCFIQSSLSNRRGYNRSIFGRRF